MPTVSYSYELKENLHRFSKDHILDLLRIGYFRVSSTLSFSGWLNIFPGRYWRRGSSPCGTGSQKSFLTKGRANKTLRLVESKMIFEFDLVETGYCANHGILRKTQNLPYTPLAYALVLEKAENQKNHRNLALSVTPGLSQRVLS